MKRIAIVSNSPEAIEQIRQLADTVFKPETTTYKIFCYQNVSEIKDIVLDNQDELNGWIFSGETPHHHAKPYLQESTPATHCILNGLEFFRYLLYSLYHSPSHELRVSADLPLYSADSWERALDEAAIPHDSVYIHRYNSASIDEDWSEVAEIHRAHYTSGRVDTILTSSTKVHCALDEMGIPVTQMHGSSFTIKNALLHLHDQIARQRLQYNRVALIRLEVADIEHMMSVFPGSLRFQTTELRIREKILGLCQELPGSYLTAKDHNSYEIFASRGIIEPNSTALYQLIENIRLTLNVDMIAGIGYGLTAFDAQRNAFHALSYARQKNPIQSVVAIDYDGTIVENVGTKKALTFAAASTNPRLLERLDSAGVGIKNYQKIAAIAQSLGRAFTSSEVALQMDTTERNARRILKSLLDAELINCVGEESLATRGRPTKKYQLNPVFL